MSSKYIIYCILYIVYSFLTPRTFYSLAQLDILYMVCVKHGPHLEDVAGRKCRYLKKKKKLQSKVKYKTIYKWYVGMFVTMQCQLLV